MTPQSPAGGRFEPIHDAHAIEQVAIILHFSSPLEAKLLREAIRALAPVVKPDLPGTSEMQSFAFSLGSGPLPGSPTSTRIPGRVFHYTKPDGEIERELRIDPQGF